MAGCNGLGIENAWMRCPLFTAKRLHSRAQGRSAEVLTEAERTLGSRPAPCPYAEGVIQAEWQSATPHIDSTRNKTDCRDCAFLYRPPRGRGGQCAKSVLHQRSSGDMGHVFDRLLAPREGFALFQSGIFGEPRSSGRRKPTIRRVRLPEAVHMTEHSLWFVDAETIKSLARRSSRAISLSIPPTLVPGSH